MRTIKLLTIEDDPSLRQLLAQDLQERGYQVFQADNGAAGIEVFNRERPDCVLLDLGLPGMSGIDVLGVLTVEAPDTPVIVVSGSKSLRQAVESLRRGAWDYLIKPLEDLDELSRAVERALERAVNRRQSKQVRQRLEAEVRERTRELQAEIEERRRAEKELRTAKEAAESASMAKSQFLANMSHELRTPLNAITGMAQMLYKTHPNDEQKHFLGLILDSSNELLNIISNLLDLSTIQANRLDIRQRPFVLRDALQPLILTAGNQAREKGLRFEAVVEDSVPHEVSGDAFRFRQVLLNVLDNAIKFTEQGDIRARVSLAPGNGGNDSDASITLLCQVSDTGIGIANDKIESIFDSFTLGEHYLTKKYGGTGLGLAITRELVQMMGGEIWVESLAGRGSSFYFTVRMHKADSMAWDNGTQATPPSEGDTIGPALRILLVEDEPVSRIFTKRMLHIAGHDVLLAEDGHKSLKLLERENVDIVLMDLQLPGGNALEAARRIREGMVPGLNPKIPMVALTVQDPETPRSQDTRFDAYLLKPYEVDTLLETIEAVMTSSAAH